MYRVHLVQDNNFQIIKIGKKFHKNYKKQTMMNLKISKNILKKELKILIILKI
jgi:hypothetical protein